MSNKKIKNKLSILYILKVFRPILYIFESIYI